MISIEKKINKILQDPNLKDDVFDILEASTLIIVNEYKKQVPVDKGFLRNSVVSRVIYTGNGNEIGFNITALANNFGVKYPVKLHEGTGALKGAKDYGYTPGRVRSNQVERGIGGIRPNKFADRTREVAGPKAVKFFKDGILKLIQEK